MLDFDLDQFADSCSGGRKESEHKIPKQFIVPLQAGLEIFVVGLADDILQKRFLLDPDKRLLPFFLTDALQIAVDGPKAQVYCLRFVAVD